MTEIATTPAFSEADIEHLESLGTLAFGSKHLLKTGDVIGSIEAAVREAARVQASKQSVWHRSAGAYHTSRQDETALISEALTARLSGQGTGGKLGGKRIVDLAELTLKARDFSTDIMSADQILSAAFNPALRMSAEHTTSDFPALMRDSANKALLRGYEAARSPLVRIFRRNDRRDFKPAYSVRLGEFPALKEVLESGEVTSGTTGEEAESWSLKTYGRVFTVSRKALINDDLGSLRNFLATASQAAAACEADVLFAVLSANALAGQTLATDSTPIFDAAHGNLMAATAIDIANLGLAIQSLRLRTGVDGAFPINVEPKYLLVGPAKELVARQLMAQIAPTVSSEVQPFSLEILVEPRLALSKSWYIFASPETAAVAEYGFLSSAPGPQLASEESFSTLGLSTRVIFDCGAGAVDYRGAVRNPGA